MSIRKTTITITRIIAATERSLFFAIITACFLAITLLPVPAAAANLATLYRDGTLLELDVSARKGVVIVPLAAGLLEGTVKVSTAVGTKLLGVEIIPASTSTKNDNELDALLENRRRMEDRLQALATREEIFTAAAKSQGGKAPRKTKANPDPLQTIRQGTDFAIAQLEAVYTSRRRTEHEIKRIDTSISAARTRNRTTANSIRITVTPASGTMTVRYAIGESGWQPQYDLHLDGDRTARLQLSARLMRSYPGSAIRMSTASLAENGSATFPLPQSGLAAVVGFSLPLAEEQYQEGISNRFSGRITNTTRDYLPPGESSLYRKGSYVGRFRFEGISSGRSRIIRMGS